MDPNWEASEVTFEEFMKRILSKDNQKILENIVLVRDNFWN